MRKGWARFQFGELGDFFRRDDLAIYVSALDDKCGILLRECLQALRSDDDVAINIAIRQAGLSYLFGTVIIAASINLLAGLAG